MRTPVACLSLLLVLACGDDDMPMPGADAGPDASTCDEVCDDGDFCNGLERCVDGACSPGIAPCPPPLRCDAVAERCVPASCAVPDADGDGEAALACGGADCDDSDAAVNPSATEICDPEGVDEDCDPTTVGERDADGDGAIDAACCNGERCGTDCDDATASVFAGATEVCNETDDDCDGSVDEGTLRSFFPDTDADGFGDRLATPTPACQPSDGRVENALDCDDTDAAAAPGNLELCNGVDDDCNGVVDDAARTAVTCASSFGTPPRTFFACVDGGCVVERCSEGFADCNAERSDGCEVETRSDVNHCGACGARCGAGGTCEASTCDGVIDVAAGYEHGCAVRTSGRVVCWGANRYGQLGDGSTTNRAVPAVLTTATDAVDVELSVFPTVTGPGQRTGEYSCAMTPWLVWCWGANLQGQIVPGLVSIEPVPQPLLGVPRLDRNLVQMQPRDSLTVGGSQGAYTEDATLANDAPVFWSQPDYGLPGNLSVAPFSEDGPLERIWIGHTHACGLSVSGTAFCLGTNTRGELGSGSTGPNSSTPVRVAGGHTFTELAVGRGFACGLRADQRMLCWGDNTFGQIGVGSTTYQMTPALLPTTSVVAIDAGLTHMCALRSRGDAVCWGDNTNGQLGVGVVGGVRTSPTAVVGLTNATQLSAGGTFSCALRNDGNVWCWGANAAGQLARGVAGEATGTPAVATEL
ncbi:MAG: hypothetical protein H6720_30030 [Sandaracinus sp.]|nr:hypothetical protein [Sandaracinus sp.]